LQAAGCDHDSVSRLQARTLDIYGGNTEARFIQPESQNLKNKTLQMKRSSLELAWCQWLHAKTPVCQL